MLGSGEEWNRFDSRRLGDGYLWLMIEAVYDIHMDFTISHVLTSLPHTPPPTPPPTLHHLSEHSTNSPSSHAWHISPKTRAKTLVEHAGIVSIHPYRALDAAPLTSFASFASRLQQNWKAAAVMSPHIDRGDEHQRLFIPPRFIPRGHFRRGRLCPSSTTIVVSRSATRIIFVHYCYIAICWSRGFCPSHRAPSIFYNFTALRSFTVRAIYLGFGFPIFHPHPRSVFTTLGVTASVRGTRRKKSDLCTPYARRSCVQIPRFSISISHIYIHQSHWSVLTRRLMLRVLLNSIASLFCYILCLCYLIDRASLLQTGHNALQCRPEAAHNGMLRSSYPICTKPSYSQEAKGKVQSRKSEIYSDNRPSIFPRHCSHALGKRLRLLRACFLARSIAAILARLTAPCLCQLRWLCCCP